MSLIPVNFMPSTPPGVGASCLCQTLAHPPCEACVQVCPVGAIHLSSGRPVLDESVCIRCGHCLFICPTDALQHLTPASRPFCGDTLVAPFSDLAPLPEELIMWHHEYGIRRVALDMNENPDWALSIAALNIWLRKINQPAWQIIPPEKSRVNRSRRFLMQVPDRHLPSARVMASARARRALMGQFSEYELTLTDTRCVGCGACARVCPEQAMVFRDAQLEWASARCTGCGSCRAVCIYQAITLEPMIQPSKIKTVGFLERVCACCQGQFYATGEGQTHCHICQRRNSSLREA